MCMAQARSLYDQEVAEKAKLSASYDLILEANRSLANRAKDLESQLGLSEEKLLAQTSRIEDAEKAVSIRDAEIADLKVQQVASSLSLAEKDSELAKLRAQVAEIEQCHEATEAENSVLKADLRTQTQLAASRQEDITWILQRGISGAIQVLLNSDEFVNRNARLQEEAKRFGQDEGCSHTQERFPDVFRGVAPLYHFPKASENILNLFSDLTSANYSLIQAFEGGLVSLEELKIMLTPEAPEDVGESSTKNQDP